MSRNKILIVEDEVLIADDLRRKLEKEGCSVTAIAVSGEKALQSIENERPDLILMDIVIKGDMDGIDTAGQIKKQYGIPFIYLTAFCDDEMLLRVNLTEPSAILTKPCELEQLITHIENALK